MKLLIALLFASTLSAGNYSISLTNDVLFAPFSQTEGTHSTIPDLIGVKVQRQFGEIAFFAKYNQTISPTRFSYAVDADSVNGNTQFPTKHFDMVFDAAFNDIMLGVSLNQYMYGFMVNADLSIGRGNYSARFIGGLEATDSMDGSVLYAGNSVVSDCSIGVTKTWGKFFIGVNVGYLFASCGDGGLKANRDYDIFSNVPGPEITKGSTIPGTLDYSGFKSGLSMGFAF